MEVQPSLEAHVACSIPLQYRVPHNASDSALSFPSITEVAQQQQSVHARARVALERGFHMCAYACAPGRQPGAM